MSRSVLPPVAIEYPSGDGKPLAENDAQLAAIHYGIGALRVLLPGPRRRIRLGGPARVLRGGVTPEYRSRPTCSWRSGSKTGCA